MVRRMSEDLLSVKGIKKYLNNEDYNLSVYECLDSTNSFLKEKAVKGEKEWTVVIADSQTSGRGRMTRVFHSPKQTGIYMSILLKPELSAEKSVFITAAAAVSVSKAIERLSGKETKIKWDNDVFIGNKKVCGILIEGGINPIKMSFDWVVLGIGINVYEPAGGFSSDISDIAGAVFDKALADNRNRLIAEILNNFREYYANLENTPFFEGYKNRMLNIGKEVNVIKGDNVRNALCLDLDSDCRLLVKYPDSKEEYLSSGEISVRIT